jgi:hypothetical protein
MSQSQFGSKFSASPSSSNSSPNRSNPSPSRNFEAASFGVSTSDIEGIATEISNCKDSAIEGKVEEAITALLAVDPVVFKEYRKLSFFSLSYLVFPDLPNFCFL